jgi:hypothetical protein
MMPHEFAEQVAHERELARLAIAGRSGTGTLAARARKRSLAMPEASAARGRLRTRRSGES